VHALRHVHGLVAPGGTLLDIHPVTEEHIEAAGKLVGVIPEPDWLTGDLPNSERALHEAITDGLYELEAETAYDVLQHFDHPDELIEAKSDLLEPHQALVEAVRRAPAPLRTRMRVVFRRLRVLPERRL
jgi:hypothetical protein